MQTPFLLKIIDAQYVKDHTLRLTFNNGEVRMCDFWLLAQKGICIKLQDLDYFRSFTLDPYTVDWNNEIGFAPEYLYEISKPTQYNFDEEKKSGMVADDNSLNEQLISVYAKSNYGY